MDLFSIIITLLVTIIGGIIVAFYEKGPLEDLMQWLKKPNRESLSTYFSTRRYQTPSNRNASGQRDPAMSWDSAIAKATKTFKSRLGQYSWSDEKLTVNVTETNDQTVTLEMVIREKSIVTMMIGDGTRLIGHYTLVVNRNGEIIKQTEHQVKVAPLGSLYDRGVSADNLLAVNSGPKIIKVHGPTSIIKNGELVVTIILEIENQGPQCEVIPIVVFKVASRQINTGGFKDEIVRSNRKAMRLDKNSSIKYTITWNFPPSTILPQQKPKAYLEICPSKS